MTCDRVTKSFGGTKLHYKYSTVCLLRRQNEVVKKLNRFLLDVHINKTRTAKILPL